VTADLIRYARVRCSGCGEPIGFVVPGDTDATVNIQLRRPRARSLKHRTVWMVNLRPTRGPAAFDLTDDEELVLTGCPRCFAFLVVNRTAIRSAIAKYAENGKTQEISAIPRSAR